MVKSFRKYLAVLLTTLILVSGSGVVLAIHTCYSKAVTDVSLYSAHDCCKGKSNNHKPVKTFEEKCCSLSFSYHKVQIQSSLDVKDYSDFVKQLASVEFKTLLYSFSFSEGFTSVNYNHDPPDERSSLAKMYCSLLI